MERAYAAVRDEGLARTVTVFGATGIGKTRLVRDFLVRARQDGDAPRVYRGAARDGGPAYEVFARALRARFGLVDGMEADAAKAQVRSHLATVLDDRKVGDVAYFLGHLLDLGFQGSPLIKAIEGDPEHLRSLRRAVIKSFLEADANKGSAPLALVLDDLHWAHDDSLELLAYLVDSLRGRILVLCVARPEMLARRDGWRRHGAERHSVLELSSLADLEAAALVRDLLSPCGAAPDVDRLVEEAVELGGGNPALLEQIVRIYHEAGVLQAADDFEEERWTIQPEKLAGVKLPLSVEDAVQARISALSRESRDLLERAAAMGGVFWLGGIVATFRQSDSPPDLWEGGEAEDVVRLRQLLSDLVERDYVLRLPDGTFAGDEEYVFKHNLEREALVAITSPATARRYHRAIAEWLSFREGADSNEEYLEMLGRHRERAGSAALGAASYIQAGDAARRRYAIAKAAELYTKGLALLVQCDHADEDLRLHALQNHGDVLQSLGRNADALRPYVESLTRSWRLDLRSKGGNAHSRIGRLYRETGRLDEASRHLTAALALFGQAKDEGGIASALDDIAKLHWLKGDYPLALEYTLRGLALRRKLGDRRGVALSLNNLGLVHNDAGNFQAALDAFQQALRIRREIGDAFGESVTLNALGMVARDTHDDEQALTRFSEAYEAARESGDRNRTATILANLAAAHHRLGDAAKSAAALKQAEDMTDELGAKLGFAEATGALAKAYLTRHEQSRAVNFMRRSVSVLESVQSTVELGVALRLLGELLAGEGTPVSGVPESPAASARREAAEHMKRSVSIFEALGNEIELARTCRSYAELLARAPEYQKDSAVAAQAKLLAKRADDIFKARMTAAGAGAQAAFAR